MPLQFGPTLKAIVFVSSRTGPILRRMEPNSTPHAAGRPDALIAALLDAAGEPGSIVDRLMSLPLQGHASEAGAWDLAVARRLEAKLAARMRSAIEGADEAA